MSRQELRFCGMPGCPGHYDDRNCVILGLNYCGKPGCPGHAKPGDECLLHFGDDVVWFCKNPRCIGHKGRYALPCAGHDAGVDKPDAFTRKYLCDRIGCPGHEHPWQKCY